MYPYGFGPGEATPARYTFQDFQTMSEEARGVAARRLRNTSHDDIMGALRRDFQTANDNGTKVGDEVTAILLDKDLRAMLELWGSCGRDMVLTKLSWDGR